MKLKIDFSPNTKVVPFDYISKLNGYLHNVLGEKNKYHDDISLYSTSFLHNGKISKDKKSLYFKNGAVWYVSSPDNKFIADFISNIYNHLDFAFGMKLLSVNKIDDVSYDLSNKYIFYTKSPILLKGKDTSGILKNIYYTYDDEISSDIMKDIVINKSSKMGYNFKREDFNLYFNTSYINKKIKFINVKGIINKSSACPVVLETSNKDIVDFVYNVGVGHSTGSGFGFLL
jgi:CRISPR-associated endoribonuclease Cas6